MVGQTETQNPRSASAAAQGPAASDRLLPAKVKLELEKNRTIVFLNKKVQDLTRKLQLCHDDLFEYEKTLTDLKNEQREISVELPIKYGHLQTQYLHVQKTAAGALAEKHRRSSVVPVFRFWVSYVNGKKGHLHLGSIVERRRNRALLVQSLENWQETTRRARRAVSQRERKLKEGCFTSWSDSVSLKSLLEAKLQKFTLVHAPFHQKRLAGTIFQAWLAWLKVSKQLRVKEAFVSNRVLKRVLGATFVSWASWVARRVANYGRATKYLRRRRRLNAFRGWSSVVERRRRHEAIVSKSSDSRRRRTLANVMSAWRAAARRERALRQKEAILRLRFQTNLLRNSVASWQSVATRERKVQRARAGFEEKRVRSALKAWWNMCALKRRVREFSGKLRSKRVKACFALWKHLKERFAYSKLVSMQRYHQKKRKLAYQLFCRWRFRVISDSRHVLIKKLETFEEGLAEVIVPHIASPLKTARQAQAQVRAKSDVNQVAVSVSAVDSFQWHRFSKGYLINRASHSAVFVRSPSARLPQFKGQYLIFGGHDLESRQNIFTIVNINVHMGDMASLRFKAEIAFEADTSIDGPCPRSDHCMCAIDHDNVAIFGGFDGTKELGDVYQITWVNEPLPEIQCKRLVSHLDSPVRRSHHTVCKYDKPDGTTKFILFGGFSKKNGGLMNDVWSFDIKSNSWQLLEATGDIPSPRRDHCAVVVNSSEMLVFGGFNGTENVNEFFSFNLLTLRWTKIMCDGQVPGARRQHSMVQVDKDNVVICGGIDRSEVLQDIHVFNVNSLQCHPMGAVLDGGRCLHSCASLGSNLLLFGGVTGAGEAVNDLLLLEHVAASSTAYLSSKANSLQDKIYKLEKELDSEIASKTTFKTHHAKEKTRNTFLESSLKNSIEQQKELANSYGVIKGKLSKHRKEERALEQSCRDLKKLLAVRNKEIHDAKKRVSATLKHCDEKVLETKSLTRQLEQANKRIESHESLLKEQTLNLQKLTETLQSSSDNLSAQQREKESLEYELTDRKSEVNHLEKVTLSLEEKLQSEISSASEVEKDLNALEAQKVALEIELDDLKQQERTRIALESAKRPKDAAIQVSPMEESVSKSTQSMAFGEWTDFLKAMIRAEEQAQSEQDEAKKSLEKDLRKNLERMAAEMFDLGARNKSLGDQLEYKDLQNSKLVQTISALEDQNKFLEASLAASKNMQQDAYRLVEEAQGAAESEISKLKMEISRLRSSKYKQDLMESTSLEDRKQIDQQE